MEISPYVTPKKILGSDNLNADESFMNTILENLVEENENMYHKRHGQKQKGKEIQQFNPAPSSLLRDNELIRISEASCSKEIVEKSVSDDGSRIYRVSDKEKGSWAKVEKLVERIEILEKETSSMKQLFFWGAKEREELETEIKLLFQNLHTNLCLSEQVEGTVRLSEDGRFKPGLAEVLCKNGNPLIIRRDKISSRNPFK